MTWQPSEFWTDERIMEAHRLYVIEGRSAAYTAKQIGAVSRNAVIGKASRMGWSKDDTADGAMRKANSLAGRGMRKGGRKTQAKFRNGAESRKLQADYFAHKKPRARAGIEVAPMIGVAGGARLPMMNVGMPANADPIAFWKRPAHRCAWPIGPADERGGADSECCGAPVSGDGRPYCETHERRSSNGKKLPEIKVYEPRVVKRAPAREDRAAA